MNATLQIRENSRLSGLSATAIRDVKACATALELGQVDEANWKLACLRAANAKHPEVLRLFAGLQNLRGQQVEAVETMQRALELRPNDALYLNTLGSILIDTGSYDEAIAVLQRACKLDERLRVAWLNLGICLVRSMRPAQAADALRRVLDLAPEQVDAHCMLADQLKASGRIDEAIAEFRRVLVGHPAAGMAWWGLADIKTTQLGDDDIAEMQRALQTPNVSDADLIAIGFALAKAQDDTGNPAQALGTLEAANQIARRRQHWSSIAHGVAVDAVLAAFTTPIAPSDSNLGSEVVFIASLPRSGSTLIEQILASHSQIEGAGELPDMPLVLTEESRRRNQTFPQWVPAMQAQDWERLGRRYMQRTAHRRERRPHFTDKLPYNWMYVGAIRAMLPGARIVIVRRDPLETCLSCYRQYLVNNEYTRRFDDLAAFWRDFNRAVRHWRTLYPQRIHESTYEELVADPEANIRALLEFCELPFESACLEFHKAQRDVHTPSAAQVREPLRGDSARAARYGGLLDPLRLALGMTRYVPVLPD